MNIKILGPKNCPDMHSKLPNFVNTTSHAKDYGRNFSPFFLGPVVTYDNAPAEYACNVENLWQYSKIYDPYIGPDDNPTDDYFINWARIGFLSKRAHRYPMGKGAKPQYSWWDGEKLSYIEARNQIYIPKYIEALSQQTAVVDWLRDKCKKHNTVYLWDFDGYDHNKENMSLEDVLNDASRPMGHAFVIKMYLTGQVDDIIK